MKVFVDSWGLKAVYDPRDSNHDVALAYRESIQKGEGDVSGFMISDYILDESLTLVRIRAGHREAVELLDAILGSPFYELVEVDGEAWSAAVAMFRKYSDKRWSFTDCTSFVLMERLGLTEAFTFDKNFKQAGFSMAPLAERDPERIRPSASAPRALAASPPPGTRAKPRRPSRRGRTPTRS